MLMIFSSLISGFFYFLELSKYPNYVFSTFHFHPDLFLAAPVFLWLNWVLTVIFFHGKRDLWIAPFIVGIFVMLVLLRLANPNLFEWLGNEDGLIEWLSVVALFFVSVQAVKKLKHRSRLKN